VPKKKIVKEVKLDLFGFFKTQFANNPRTGEIGLKIIGFKDIKYSNELDKEYMDEPPYFYRDELGDFVKVVYLDNEGKENSAILKLDEWINFDDFAFYYRQILRACYKLSNKNKEYDKMFNIMFSSYKGR
jgi:hypothetical protein